MEAAYGIREWGTVALGCAVTFFFSYFFCGWASMPRDPKGPKLCQKGREIPAEERLHELETCLFTCKFPYLRHGMAWFSVLPP